MYPKWDNGWLHQIKYWKDVTYGRLKRPIETLSRRIHPQADFYLIVQGDSMDRVGYGSGDIVAVRRNPEPNEGDVVIARIGQEVTLKCFHRAGRDRIELQPRSSNPEHQPIVIDGTTADWEIVGVVVGAMIGARPTTGC